MSSSNLLQFLQSISPGAVDTEIFTPEAKKLLSQDPQFTLLKTGDIVNAVVYVLSTPPHCQVSKNKMQSCTEIASEKSLISLEEIENLT